MLRLKPARRQAFRYGMQVAELQKVGNVIAATSVKGAYAAFLNQFDDDDYALIKRWLHNEYELGLDGALPLSGFMTNEHDDTISKTYHVK